MSPDSLVELLGKELLISAVAATCVLLLRSVVRRLFDARAAYLLWWCVPVMMLGVLLPAPQAATVDALKLVILRPQLDAWLTAQGGHQSGGVQRVATGMLCVWLAGALVMLFGLIRRQRRFVCALGTLEPHADVALSDVRIAGLPAAIGLWRPRIVLPPDFLHRFNVDEQALIIAHERAHLRRGDPWANAFASLVLCLHWFNPLMHLALRRFRLDQELACDAVVIAGAPARRKTYANAMLKTSLVTRPTPLGCHWQNDHPLKERIAMLKDRKPSVRKHIFATVLVTSLVAGTGYSAWATRLTQLTPADQPAQLAGHDRNAFPPPRYPLGALKRNQSGEVTVLVDVDVQGRATHVVVDSSKPAGVFDQAVLEVAGHWRFTPAQVAGKPVASRVRVPIYFDTMMMPAATPAGYAAGAYEWYRLKEPGKAAERPCDVVVADPAAGGARTLCGIREVAAR